MASGKEDHPNFFQGMLKIIWPCNCWVENSTEDDEVRP